MAHKPIYFEEREYHKVLNFLHQEYDKTLSDIAVNETCNTTDFATVTHLACVMLEMNTLKAIHSQYTRIQGLTQRHCCTRGRSFTYVYVWIERAIKKVHRRIENFCEAFPLVHAGELLCLKSMLKDICLWAEHLYEVQASKAQSHDNTVYACRSIRYRMYADSIHM